MTFVCATHPQLEATARCVRCGVHLCPTCRTLDGVKNYCASCRSHVRVPAASIVAGPALAAAGGVQVAIPVATATAAPRGKSAWLAATLSLVPGLGQAYAGRAARGAGLFVAALALRDAPFMTPLLGAYLYVFGLFDAFRCAELRSGSDGASKSGRFDDVLFLLAGLGAIGATLAAHGGFAAAPRELLVPLAGIAASLLFAHETRR